MVRWMVGASQKFGHVVLAIAVAIMAIGFVQGRNSTVEAVPEFGPVRVDVQVEALGLSAEEVENLITNPIENEFFNGIPWLAKLESRTIPGLASLEMTFEPGTDPIRARQVVQERLTMAPALPQASSKPPLVVQPLSSTGRVMMIGLSSTQRSLIDLSLRSRWTIVPRLLSVPGVANVAIWGFRDRQLQVQVDPARLIRQGVTLDQVLRSSANALWVSPLTFVEASTPGLGGFVDTANQRIEIQHNQPITSASELGKVTVQGAEARGVRLEDVATITEDHQLLIGDALVQDTPSLMLVVERFPGASVTEVTRDVEAALAELRPGLDGIQVDTSIYRPASYVEQLLDNLLVRLLAGALLLALLLGAVFVDWRLALISLISLTASVAGVVAVLPHLGVPFTTMSLVGLVMALLVVVDDVVVGVEAIRRRLREAPDGSGRGAVIGAAVTQMRVPLLVATVITVVSVAPVFLLDGVTGAFLTPVAQSFLVGVAVAMLVALTVTPALATVLLARGPRRFRSTPLAARMARGYGAAVARWLARPRWSMGVAAVLTLLTLAAMAMLGGRPVAPTLHERDLLVAWETVPGTSRQEMDRVTAALTTELRAVPGIDDVGAHIGRALASDQVVNVNSGEVWVSIGPEADYTRTLATVREIVDGYPGIRGDVSTYTDKRVREVVTRGSAEDLVVRVYGNDYAVLNSKAQEVRDLVAGVPGVTEPRVVTAEVAPTVEIEVSVERAARYGLKPGDVRRAAATLVAATVAGHLFDEQKVFEVVVWGTPEVRRDLHSIRELLIDAPVGGADGGPTQVRLADVAEVRLVAKPEMIWHDQVSRSIDVVAQVRGRGLATVTAEVTERVSGVSFPREHHLEVLGEARSRQATGAVMWAYVVGAVILVYFLLQAAFAGWRLAGWYLAALPAALSGGVLVALLLGEVVSVAAMLGLLAVLALAVRGGVVTVRHYGSLRGPEALPEAALRELVVRGARQRLVPTVTGLFGAALVLVPMAVGGIVAGLEIAMPLAAIVLGGLVTTALVNLFLLPALYLRFVPRRTDQDQPLPAESPA